jgi:hypothetical protein
MRTIITLLLAFVVTLGASAQDDQTLSRSELRKLQREQRKAERAAEQEQMAKVTELMIAQQHFVLEAEFLSNKTGSRIPVQSTINFILVDSVEAIVQFGSASSAGYNGVGGATIEGKISKYEYSKIGRNNDSFSISMSFMSSLGIYDITMLVSASGNTDATIRGSWSGSLSYHGKLVPLIQSRIYKGTTTY